MFLNIWILMLYSYPKYVLTLDEFPMGEDGIEQKNIIDFLLEEN